MTERGRVKPYHPGEEVAEEPLGVAQERALRLDASQLLEESEGDDLRVCKPFEGLVASSFGVEGSVGVVDEAEQDGERLFRSSERRCKLSMGHPLILWSGFWMALVLAQQTTQHSSSRSVLRC
jgi:hypothetical protein